MTDSSVFSADALANALEHREQQLRDQRRHEDAQRIVRTVSEKLDEIAYERVYGAPPQGEVVNANPQSTSSGQNGSHEPPPQPAAQQGEGQSNKPGPIIELAARQIAASETIDISEIKRQAMDIASFKGRDSEQIAVEITARVNELRGEADNPSVSQQSSPFRVPGSRVVKNLFSRDDHKE